MAGAGRLVGGMQTPIEALAKRLKSGRLLLGHRLQSPQAHENWIAAPLLAHFRFELEPNSLPMPTMSMTVRPGTGVRLALKRI